MKTPLIRISGRKHFTRTGVEQLKISGRLFPMNRDRMQLLSNRQKIKTAIEIESSFIKKQSPYLN
jgi:hypothetical protein